MSMRERYSGVVVFIVVLFAFPFLLMLEQLTK